MRALVCARLEGEDGLELRDDWPIPDTCGPNQVRISVRAASVNFPDSLVIRGRYQMKPDPPFVPGNECAGVVTEVGGEVQRLAVGDRVLALTGIGAFAEEVVATLPHHQVHRIPDVMSWDHAAALDLTYGTAYHGLVLRGGVGAGASVLVLGAAGGCGSAAVQVGRALGARVIGVAGGPEKVALATELGADAAIDHRSLEGDRALSRRVHELTDGRGVDVVFDPVGGADIRDLLRCLAWNGRYLVVGFADGSVPTVPLNLTILKSISLVGVAYGASAIVDPAANDAAFARLFAWYREGRVRPHVGHRFPLAEGAAAIATLTDRAALGKVVVEVGSGPRG
jgi:NADPH2:quinone reductase